MLCAKNYRNRLVFFTELLKSKARNVFDILIVSQQTKGQTNTDGNVTLFAEVTNFFSIYLNQAARAVKHIIIIIITVC